MARESNALRSDTRRVKAHILNRFLKLADYVDAGSTLTGDDKDLYKELMMTFARNVVPRSTELTGEDGEKILIPIYGGVSKHDSHQEDIQPKEEN